MLTDAPIPPRPAEFTPFGAPPGVSVDFHAFTDDHGMPWWTSRPKITPRLQLVHTNAASVEGSLQSQINWGNAGRYTNTHPHYAINAPRPTKLVPTDRRGIGNSTAPELRPEHGNVSDWSIVIETADAGTKARPDVGPFLYDHAELVARILAYESIVHDIPLEYPDEPTEAGTACHTEPFGYPWWTSVKGKTCPGKFKKAQMREDILPRARQIRAAWTEAPVTTYPTRYGTRQVTINELFAEHHIDKMHPVFAARLRAWLEAQGGHVGIGGSWRADGTQPDDPGFAPEGRSFHQHQRFASGRVAFCAVDLVVGVDGGIHRAPRWDEVPAQGTAEAARWGVHCNVGTPGTSGAESWHMQPVEVDGWQSWIDAGSPDPTITYRAQETEMKITTPTRVLDTRHTAKLTAGQAVEVVVEPGATAAFVNLTVTEADGRGYVTAWSGVGPKPNVSNLNYQRSESICNTSWVPLDNGRFTAWTKAACHLVVDVQAVA